MTGLNYGQDADVLVGKCVKIYGNPIARCRLPIPKSENEIFEGWKVPEEVKTKTIALCTALNSEYFAEAINKLDRKVTLHWERDEFRFLVDNADISWPEFVEHKKLKLLKNRYPVVPGFDNKTRLDVYLPPETLKPLPVSPKDFMKSPTTWKVKNIIPTNGVVHRYASRFGKRFPIMRKTAETSRFADMKKIN
jgi:hypothetical protein